MKNHDNELFDLSDPETLKMLDKHLHKSKTHHHDTIITILKDIETKGNRDLIFIAIGCILLMLSLTYFLF